MKIHRSISLFLITTAQVWGQDVPKAPDGYEWKKFRKAEVEIRVPKKWNIYEFKEGMRQVLQVTKDKKGKSGFQTGLTVQYFSCSSQEEYAAVVAKAGDFLSGIYDDFEEITDSRIYEKEGRFNMILEGKRKMPEKKDGILYHTRTAVRAFHKAKVVYIYVFGAPDDSPEEDIQAGEIMLNPIVFRKAVPRVPIPRAEQ